MDPYGLVRQRVQSSQGRFWTWLDRRSANLHEPMPQVHELEAEGVLVLDRNAWIAVRPRGWRGSLPFNRGKFGSVVLTGDRLLIGIRNATTISIPRDSESFQNLYPVLTGNSQMYLDLISKDDLESDNSPPRRVSITSSRAHEFALAIKSAQSSCDSAPASASGRDLVE